MTTHMSTPLSSHLSPHASHQTSAHAAAPAADEVVQLSARKFMIGCVVAAAGIAVVGRFVDLPTWLLAAEVFATIVALFVLGSFKYQLHKNALTYGAALVILATFAGVWRAQHHAQGLPSAQELSEAGHALVHGLFTWHGINELVHADTMLFILGLTFFVSVIAQTRLLESITFRLLRLNRGAVLPTILAVTAVVSVASGILDGVSMIGLTIRTLVIILVLAAANTATIRYAVMVCTVVTTVCGMWLAYGEPPNLIMKANVVQMVDGKHRYLLSDVFFLKYCAPAAVLTFVCVALSLRRKLRGGRIEMDRLDILDANVATVRFLQAERHGRVFTPLEFVEECKDQLGDKHDGVLRRLRAGESLGLALVREELPHPIRVKVLGDYVSEDLAVKLDRHYVLENAGQSPGTDEGEAAVEAALKDLSDERAWSRRIGALALIPFIGLLITHALNHAVPLFLASCAGFLVALAGIWKLPRMRKLALHEGKHEYSEYYFLFPLFLSVTLLTRVGFFDVLGDLIKAGVEDLGALPMAFAQFFGATALSAILDNNVVADFAGRAIRELPEMGVIFLFSLAQIAGYAAGGCWTHIGSAQSVVAFAFIKRDVDARFTPVTWIREMTPLLVSIVVVLSIWIALVSVLF